MTSRSDDGKPTFEDWQRRHGAHGTVSRSRALDTAAAMLADARAGAACFCCGAPALPLDELDERAPALCGLCADRTKRRAKRDAPTFETLQLFNHPPTLRGQTTLGDETHA